MYAVTEQVFYRSKDSTRVPMFITRKPVWMQIDDFADQWAFVSQALHME